MPVSARGQEAGARKQRRRAGLARPVARRDTVAKLRIEVGLCRAVARVEHPGEVVDPRNRQEPRLSGFGKGMGELFAAQDAPEMLVGAQRRGAEADGVHAGLLRGLANARERIRAVEEPRPGTVPAHRVGDLMDEGDLAQGVARARHAAELGDQVPRGMAMDGLCVHGPPPGGLARRRDDHEVRAVERGRVLGAGCDVRANPHVLGEAAAHVGHELDALAVRVHEHEVQAVEPMLQVRLAQNARAKHERPGPEHRDLAPRHAGLPHPVRRKRKRNRVRAPRPLGALKCTTKQAGRRASTRWSVASDSASWYAQPSGTCTKSLRSC